jgi:hypothetical protein
MAEKKMTAAETRAAEAAAAETAAARKQTERKRLLGAGAVLAAIALFAGGYAIGNASDDDRVIGSDVALAPFDLDAREAVPFPGFDFDDRRGPGGDRGPFPGDRRGPHGGFGFHDECPFLDDYGFGEGFEFPEGIPFFDEDGRRGPGPFPFPEGGFGFSLECTSDGQCTFTLPDGFEFGEGFEFSVPDADEGPGNDDIPGLPGEPGFLGVAVTEAPDGVVVTELAPGSPAEQAGIVPGDLILQVDGAEIEVTDDLVDAIQDAGAGTTVAVTVGRGEGRITFQVTLSAPPA